MLHAIATVWLMISIGAGWTTWLEIRRILAGRRKVVYFWDQWANLSSFLHIVRAEKDALVRSKYAHALGGHIVACISAVGAFALLIYAAVAK